MRLSIFHPRPSLCLFVWVRGRFSGEGRMRRATASLLRTSLRAATSCDTTNIQSSATDARSPDTVRVYRRYSRAYRSRRRNIRGARGHCIARRWMRSAAICTTGTESGRNPAVRHQTAHQGRRPCPALSPFEKERRPRRSGAVGVKFFVSNASFTFGGSGPAARPKLHSINFARKRGWPPREWHARRPRPETGSRRRWPRAPPTG